MCRTVRRVTKVKRHEVGLQLTVLSLFCLLSCSALHGSEKLELIEGDRVVLLGGTYVERMQAYGYLEQLLTAAYPKVTFRNLGWSGDDATGLARAVFGKPADGYKRLIKDLTEAKPTVVIICYGGNEAHAGDGGLSQFTANLNRLLDSVAKVGARTALVSPMSYEKLGPPLPDPTKYNAQLKKYCDAIRATAKERHLPYFDVYNRLAPIQNVSKTPAIRDTLTTNGVHLSEYGYWRTAPRVAKNLGVSQERWSVDIDVKDKSYDAVGTMLSDIKIQEASVQFEATDIRLTNLAPPDDSPRGGRLVAPHDLVRVRGLAAGKYGFRINEQPTIMADEKQWSAGIYINRGEHLEQLQQLRAAIAEKNMLYFNRYRPQNETYLFLFRKHEQGNNAVEIPQFDPLIAEKEKEIARLRIPMKIAYDLVRLNIDNSAN